MSKKANNGTDVNSGQIPSILYRVVNQESKLPIVNSDIDPVHKVSQQFANTVTKDCFQSLITLLKWSWGTFKLTLNDLKDKVCTGLYTSFIHLLFHCFNFFKFFRRIFHSRWQLAIDCIMWAKYVCDFYGNIPMKSIQMTYRKWKKIRQKNGTSTMMIEMKHQSVISWFAFE